MFLLLVQSHPLFFFFIINSVPTVHPAVLMYLSQSLVAGHCVTFWGHRDSVRVCGSSWWAGANSQTESRPPWLGINQICRSSAWCLHARHRGGAHRGTKLVPCYFFVSLRAAFLTFWWFSRRNLNPHQTNVLDSLCLSLWRNAWLAQISTHNNLTLLLEWCLFISIYIYISGKLITALMCTFDARVIAVLQCRLKGFALGLVFFVEHRDNDSFSPPHRSVLKFGLACTVCRNNTKLRQKGIAQTSCAHAYFSCLRSSRIKKNLGLLFHLGSVLNKCWDSNKFVFFSLNTITTVKGHDYQTQTCSHTNIYAVYFFLL